ncbi:hypothetical protein GQ42DRAFT_21969 [Ramicandelaber brevisporus]|nr:hypothetical protein GQ42DRAFT_21969 [Ramicandelaber brevisporus]
MPPTSSFPKQLYALLTNPLGKPKYIRFSDDGTSIVITNRALFEKEELSLLFRRQTKFASFKRQMSDHQFRNLRDKRRFVGCNVCEWQHAFFVRGRPDHLYLIVRKKRTKHLQTHCEDGDTTGDEQAVLKSACKSACKSEVQHSAIEQLMKMTDVSMSPSSSPASPLQVLPMSTMHPKAVQAQIPLASPIPLNMPYTLPHSVTPFYSMLQPPTTQIPALPGSLNMFNTSSGMSAASINQNLPLMALAAMAAPRAQTPSFQSAQQPNSHQRSMSLAGPSPQSTLQPLPSIDWQAQLLRTLIPSDADSPSSTLLPLQNMPENDSIFATIQPQPMPNTGLPLFDSGSVSAGAFVL